MELYYKDLISEDASLEKLVDDLLNVVQGVDEFAQAAGASLPAEHKEEVTSQLQKLKESCNQIRQHALTTVKATDKMIHRNPYSVAGFVFVLGVITGALAFRSYYRRTEPTGSCGR